MDRKKTYKPLWMIHNRTYRQLAREARKKRLEFYVSKARKMLEFKLRRRG